MNAQDVIESYVTDVALRLPRKQRNDVAFELRTLLTEELQAKIATDGHDVNAQMATDLLQEFGHPAEVAARYLPELTIIDPADGRAFVQATIVGLAIIWSAGLLQQLRQPIASGFDLLRVIGQWWGTAVLPSLWWPGALLAGFGLTAWARRRWPQTTRWKPMSGDRIRGGRAAMVLGIVGVVCGVCILIAPRWWLLDLVLGGHAAPVAYAALTYTESFLHRQAPMLLALILLNVPLFVTVVVQGRWSAPLRRLDTVLCLVTCVAMVWTILDGPIVMTATSDHMAKVLMALVVAVVLIDRGIKMRRHVNPTPV
ncbi:MAG: hypothetical protein WBV39_08475 [Rudaea sp.]